MRLVVVASRKNVLLIFSANAFDNQDRSFPPMLSARHVGSVRGLAIPLRELF